MHFKLETAHVMLCHFICSLTAERQAPSKANWAMLHRGYFQGVDMGKEGRAGVRFAVGTVDGHSGSSQVVFQRRLDLFRADRYTPVRLNSARARSNRCRVSRARPVYLLGLCHQQGIGLCYVWRGQGVRSLWFPREPGLASPRRWQRGSMLGSGGLRVDTAWMSRATVGTSRGHLAWVSGC